MPRKGPAKKREIVPDPVYGNRMVSRLIKQGAFKMAKKVLPKRLFMAHLI